MCSILASQAPRSAAVAPARRAEIWVDAGTFHQGRQMGSGSRLYRKRVSHRVLSYLSSIACPSSANASLCNLTAASSHYAAALTRLHTLPHLGQGNAFQGSAQGSVDRQEPGLQSKNSSQSSLCGIRSFTGATGVCEWNVLVGVWELILLGFASLCGEPKADCCY